MVILEVEKSNDVLNTITAQDLEKMDVKILESNSLGFDAIIQIFIPISAILAPVISSVISKVLETKKITIKYKDIEVSASSYKEVEKALSLIDKCKNNED